MACGLLFALQGVTCAQSQSWGQGKFVVIDKTRQLLMAYQNTRLVLSCRISTGRHDEWTPNGEFRAGEKFLMHYSTLFQHAPMPYSVQVSGNIFIHGFAEVPPWPASHGCIRVPLTGANPARAFFYWVERGTPIRIQGKWRERIITHDDLVLENRK